MYQMLCKERRGPRPHGAALMQSSKSQGHGGTLHPLIVSCFFFFLPLLLPLPQRAGFGTRQIWNSILAMPFFSQVTLGLNSLSLDSCIGKMGIIPTLQGCWECWIREIRWSTWHWDCMPKFTINIRCYFNSCDNHDVFAPLGYSNSSFPVEPVSVLPSFTWLQSFSTFHQVALSL